MTHEKIIKRENGDSVLIRVAFRSEYFRNEFHYSPEIAKKAKGKRTWIYERTGVIVTQSTEPREQFATQKEILQAKLELWEKMKPE
jgi:hypothetical protein